MDVRLLRKCKMKRFFSFTIPSILAMWVYSLYTMVDGFFVANFVGDLEFSAINISMPVVTSFFALGILFSIGVQALVGQALGGGRPGRAKTIFTTGILGLVLVGVAYLIILAIFFDPLLRLLGATPQSYPHVKTYLGTVLPFGLFFMLSYQLEVLVKVDGFPLVSTLGVMSAALTNVLLDYIFIVQLQMGIFGAALATGLAQLVSSLVFLGHFFRKKGTLGLVKSLDPPILKRAIPLGLGDSLAEIALGYMVFIYNNSLLYTYGQEGVIAYTVVSYVTSFVSVTMSGVAQGLSPLFAYDYGKKDYSKIRFSYVRGLVFVLLVALVANLILRTLDTQIIGIFLSDSPDLYPLTQTLLARFALAFPFMGLNILTVTLFASLGLGRISLLISFLRSILVLTLVVLIATYVIGGPALHFGLALSEALVALVSVYLLKKYALGPFKK